MEYVIGALVALFLVSLMARLWNEINLDSRQFHRVMAGQYILNQNNTKWRRTILRRHESCNAGSFVLFKEVSK